MVDSLGRFGPLRFLCNSLWVKYAPCSILGLSHTPRGKGNIFLKFVFCVRILYTCGFHSCINRGAFVLCLGVSQNHLPGLSWNPKAGLVEPWSLPAGLLLVSAKVLLYYATCSKSFQLYTNPGCFLQKWKAMLWKMSGCTVSQQVWLASPLVTLSFTAFIVLFEMSICTKLDWNIIFTYYRCYSRLFHCPLIFTS